MRAVSCERKDFIGKIQIGSRFGFYEFHNGRVVYEKMKADLSGTTVTIEINTSDRAQYYLATQLTPESIF